MEDTHELVGFGDERCRLWGHGRLRRGDDAQPKASLAGFLQRDAVLGDEIGPGLASWCFRRIRTDRASRIDKLTGEPPHHEATVDQQLRKRDDVACKQKRSFTDVERLRHARTECTSRAERNTAGQLGKTEPACHFLLSVWPRELAVSAVLTLCLFTFYLLPFTFYLLTFNF